MTYPFVNNPIAGHHCAYCGSWTTGTDGHWCPQMNPNQPQQIVVQGYGEIVLWLERIAYALEEITRRLPIQDGHDE